MAWFMMIWLAVHGLAYFAILGRLAMFRQERVIFRYHFLSFIALAIASAGPLVLSPSPEHVQNLILSLSMHGVYSLSFLELWSLAQGGYSVGILLELESGRVTGTAPDLSRFADIGDRKKAERLAGLEKLHLIRREQDHVALTRGGAWLASALTVVAWLANLSNDG